MIKVKRVNNVITVSGHAGYSEYGTDIVCASVSSIINTVVNSCMSIDSNSINYQDDSKVVTITKINDNENVSKILNTMIEILKDLERQYKENIKVESEE